MLYFARWKIVLIVLVVLGGFVATLPNFFPKETVANWPNWMPKRQLVLGLDLQGGAYLLYEVDRTEYVESRLRSLLSDVRKAMLEQPRIGYTGLAIQNDGVQLRIRDLDRIDDARTRLEKLTQSALNVASRRLERQRVRSERQFGWRRCLHIFAGGPDAADPRYRQPVDRGHRPPHRRAGNHGAEHPAPGRRPHPGRGARPWRPRTAEGDRRPDGAAHLPSCRGQVDAAPRRRPRSRAPWSCRPRTNAASPTFSPTCR